MKALTAEQRKAKAKAAADARWSKAKEQVKAETADSRPPKSKKTKVA